MTTCDPLCPFRGCPECPYPGGDPQPSLMGVFAGGSGCNGVTDIHMEGKMNPSDKAIPPEPSWRSAQRGDLPRLELGMTDVTPSQAPPTSGGA